MKNPKEKRMVRLYKVLIDLEEQGRLAEMGADEIVRYAATHYGAKWRLTVSAIHAAATYLKSMRLAESLKWNTLERQR